MEPQSSCPYAPASTSRTNRWPRLFFSTTYICLLGLLGLFNISFPVVGRGAVACSAPPSRRLFPEETASSMAGGESPPAATRLLQDGNITSIVAVSPSVVSSSTAGGSGDQEITDYAPPPGEEEVSPSAPSFLPTDLNASIAADLHYHPSQDTSGTAPGSAVSYLLPTFAEAPEWAFDELYIQDDYFDYYRLPSTVNISLTEQERREIVLDVRRRKAEEAARKAEEEAVEARNREESAAEEGGGASSRPPGGEEGEFEEEESTSSSAPDFLYNSEEESAMAEQVARKRAPPGVQVMCYSLSADRIVDRCSKAKDWGTGVLIQMNDRSNNYLEFGPEWYEAIRLLKQRTSLSVVGIFFGAPDWVLLDRLLSSYYPDIFDEVVINVEGQEGACITQLDSLKASAVGSREGLRISYFAKGEDTAVCRAPQDGFPSKWDLYVNHPDRRLPIPEGVAVRFPCYDGYEGRCFRAFQLYRETACDPTKQRYVFMPYERSSNRMLHLYNEICIGQGMNLPSHDVVQAI